VPAYIVIYTGIVGVIVAGIGVVEHVGKGASLMGIPMGTFMEMPMAIPM
jgi:hypothetical protein